MSIEKNTIRYLSRTIGMRLKYARKQAGLKQTDAANYLSLENNSQISRIESGSSTLSVVQLIKLCELYKIDPALVLKIEYEY